MKNRRGIITTTDPSHDAPRWTQKLLTGLSWPPRGLLHHVVFSPRLHFKQRNLFIMLSASLPPSAPSPVPRPLLHIVRNLKYICFEFSEMLASFTREFTSIKCKQLSRKQLKRMLTHLVHVFSSKLGDYWPHTLLYSTKVLHNVCAAIIMKTAATIMLMLLSVMNNGMITIMIIVIFMIVVIMLLQIV